MLAEPQRFVPMKIDVHNITTSHMIRGKILKLDRDRQHQESTNAVLLSAVRISLGTSHPYSVVSSQTASG